MEEAKKVISKAYEVTPKILANITVALQDIPITVQYRIKSEESLIEKSKRKACNLEDVTDVFGCRIIGKIQDFEAIIERLIRVFKLAKIEKLDKKDGFYSAVHLDLDLDGYKFECQIHTNGSNTVASLLHDVIYKNGGEKEAREAFNILKQFLEEKEG